MIRMTLIAAALIAAPSVANAQAPDASPPRRPAQSFEDVQAVLSVGDTVHLFDTTGAGAKGRLASIRDGVLNVTVDSTRRTFNFDTIAQIDRTRRDPVHDGVLKGLAGGAAVGFLLGKRAESAPCYRRDIECGQAAVIGAYGGAFWGAIFGWIVDASHRTRETVYEK